MWVAVAITVFLIPTQIIAMAKNIPCHAGCWPNLTAFMTIGILLVGLFYCVWFIVGNLWYFEIDSCDDFEEGYNLTWCS